MTVWAALVFGSVSGCRLEACSGGQGSVGTPVAEGPGRGRRGAKAPRTDDLLFEIPWHGGKRGAWVHVPDGISGKAPTLVVFHGGKGANGQLAAKDWMEQRDSGMILVFPNGQDERPDLAGWMPTNGDVREHVDFTLQLLDALAKVQPVDLDRVYTAGFSTGGQQAFRMACLAPERLRGAAVVAQTMEEDTVSACTRDGLPMMWITGTADPKNPPEGRPSRDPTRPGRIGIEETLNLWLRKNGCERNKEKRTDRPNLPGDETRVIDRRFEGCNNEVRFLEVVGGGHSWPSKRRGGGGDQCTDISATDEIMEFWRSYARL